MKPKRCKRCGREITYSRLYGDPRFCTDQCQEEYPALNLMERAEYACMGSPDRETHKIYSRASTWVDLLEYKDSLIRTGLLHPQNAGIWESFWGYKWTPDENMPEGDFEVR